MSDNTTSTSTARCIDRRTLLSGFGAGLVALAGCSDSTGSSNSTDRSPASSPSSETDVLESITFEGKAGYSPRVIANFQLTENSKITQVGLINGLGNEVDRAYISERETVAEFVVARLGDSPSERITQGENTLVLIGENTEVEVPLPYSASLTLHDVVGPNEYSELPEPQREGREPIGLIVENTGDHPDIAQDVISEDGPHLENFDKETSEEDLGNLVESGATTVLPVRSYLAQDFHCSKTHTRDAKLTLKSAFSDPVTFIQTFRYSPKRENFCEISLDGEQTIVERDQTTTE
ncbi:hypothetical protein [Haloarcula sp. JP-L23]|uniref:hypothetical protein n=1 Tax=Haloarcula sp. JP-L23 TaxID=2716717 RepID=UPI00140F19A4|nr:hypothetical protein G9465_23535 [Haloarcula sp. JP-L23]